MNTFFRHIQYGLRRILRYPGFSTMVILILALGIGINTIFFSLINGVLLKGLPFKQPEELVSLLQHHDQGGSILASPGVFLAWRERNKVFRNLAAFSTRDVTISGHGQAEIVRCCEVSSGLFGLLKVTPQIGRFFERDNEQPGNNNWVVISHHLWQQRFGSDPNIINQTIQIDGKALSVIGVVSAGSYCYPLTGVEVWRPMTLGGDQQNNFSMHYLSTIGRLKPNVTLERAQAAMDLLSGQLQKEHPVENKNLSRVDLTGLRSYIVHDVKGVLWLLMGAVFLVLLIACVNAAGLLLSRIPLRQKEMAIRVSLGARRSHIIFQLLAEGMVLALIGGLLGLLWSLEGLKVVLIWIGRNLPRADQIGLDRSVLMFTLGISILTGIAFGLAPAWETYRRSIIEQLKQASTQSAGNRMSRILSAVLIGSQVALATILLVASGLMARSMLLRAQTSPGFKADNLLIVPLALPPYRYSPEQTLTFYNQLTERIRRIPGVQQVALTSALPTRTGSRWSAATEAQMAQTGQEGPQAALRIVSPGYFHTMGYPLKGRDFNEQDRPGHALVVIINEKLAHKSWPDENPLGKRLKPGGANSKYPLLTVVGVIGNTIDPRNDSSEFEMYVPQNLLPWTRNMKVVIRCDGDPLKYAAAIRSYITSLDPDLPIPTVNRMRDVLHENLSMYQSLTVLPGTFALAALILSMIGLYAIISSSVNQRTHEIGVRIALGATVKDVVRMVVGQGLRLVTYGLIAGLAAALWITRLLRSLLYQISPFDPVTLGGIIAMILIVAVLACLIPARRATLIDPIQALRYE